MCFILRTNSYCRLFHSSTMDPYEVVHSEEEELSDTKALSDTDTLSERGATIMHALSRKWDGIKINVEFNGKGKPIGQKVRTKLSGWEGALARALIPLSDFQTWKKAPDELLNILWAAIQVHIICIVLFWVCFLSCMYHKFFCPLLRLDSI